MNKNITKKISKHPFFFLFTLMVMLVIFSFSCQNASVSGEVSSSLALQMGLTGQLNENGAIVYPFLGIPLRKWAHIGLYALLGFGFYGWLRQGKTALLWSYLYALSDEAHQRLVPGRSGQLVDTLIDLIGIILGIAIAIRLVQILAKYQNKKKRKEAQ